MHCLTRSTMLPPHTSTYHSSTFRHSYHVTRVLDFFLRRSTMTVWDVVGTIFNDNFVPKDKKGVGSGMGREWA
ncbi:hypothetical protein C8R41DRAFT_833971 [Lentinula lateritia]|uniref:Uncharacterized protein n=1 Tax=Lentinula lateritia TaxID=40482 RepID=A0ABQ8VGP0_9AGAR|nr:hypothetical protein C8R41DRAFT_833971 [Lentinula lateritia]